MSTVRPWAMWRRIQYGLGFLLFWSLIVVVVYFNNYYTPPNCFDGIKNGNETGVDCGGLCVQICATDVLPPRVLWSKSFKVAPGWYNAVAYVDNPNQTAGLPELDYTFQLLSQGQVVTSVTGKTELPPNTVVPLFAGRIFLDKETTIDETKVIFGDQPDYWLPGSVNSAQFKTGDKKLVDTDTKPRLEVEITNTALTPADNVELVATIFSADGEPVTASETLIEHIAAKETITKTFTWPNPIAKTIKSCVIPTDVALEIDLSGSMNDDEKNPPQPLTDTLLAASEFVGNLQASDRVALIGFATRADKFSVLTGDSDKVAGLIKTLKISPAEEFGYTNTAAALRLAGEELISPRHNTNARKVVVILTDGQPTAKSEEDAVKEAIIAANELKEKDIEIYAIGLGSKVDQKFIKEIASAPDKAYLAPSRKDLQRIYRNITSNLCEVGPARIDVLPKLKANFTPLR